MNKAVGIGAIIVVIIGIIIVSATVSNDTVEVEETILVEVEETIPVEETVEVEETIPVEETENEEKGKDITVELSEKMGFKIK